MMGQPHRENIKVLHLRTRRWNTVVAVYVRHLDAATTLLYSHGNAADLGHLYQLFLHLSFNLRVNVLRSLNSLMLAHFLACFLPSPASFASFSSCAARRVRWGGGWV
uniref:Uncharacterized protein n=2 Tax=Oryza TaxID=4527 RepID=A0A0D3F5N3_9ORYZ